MVKKVAVFFGGKSAEREISVLTGVLALRLIDPAKYAAVPVYVHSDGGFYTSDEAFYLETFKMHPFPLKKFRRCVFENDELLIFAPKKRKNRRDVELLSRRRGGKRRSRRVIGTLFRAVRFAFRSRLFRMYG